MCRIWFVLAVAVCLVGLSWAEEAPAEKAVKSKVVSVSLFKNGLAVVKRQVTIDGAGVYRLGDVPEPVHGTFWVESNMPLEARVESRDRPAELSQGFGVNLQEEMAGLKVTVHGRNNKNPIMGTVLKVPKPEEEAAASGSDEEGFRQPTPGSRFLILKTEKGYSYVDFGDIAAVESEGQPQPRTIKKSVLLITAGNDVKAGPAQISYLAHGLSWAPSYRVDVTNPKKLSIEQHAVIRNELADFADTDVSLISGYPSVQFSNVISPLAARQTWANFFNQINGTSRGQFQSFDNSQLTQNAYVGNRAAAAVAPALGANTGDTIDLHFHSIGKRTLKKGSSMALATGKAEAEYERIVDWTIPDNRDEWGSPTRNGSRVDPGTGETLQDDIWDALKFKNPLPFPMTSAPAMVVTAGNFSGQRSVLWTNTGEESTLRVNKALSIRARHVEYENQTGPNGVSDREVVYVGGRRFRKVTVNGELRLCNHRQIDAKLIIKRHFSGDFIKGDGEPKIDLREEGVWTVNRRNELAWTLSLKPAEERTIKFQYSVLIHF